MGTDIHGIFQTATDGGWVDIPSTFDQNRHYQLFAVLADVRNGYGFAGVQTGEVIRPIARRRGLPRDFMVIREMHPTAKKNLPPSLQRYGDDEMWMGDHSHSWLTGEEILAWVPPTVVKTGVIDRHQYEHGWDGNQPEGWSGGISGPGVIVVPDNALARANTPNWTHIQVEWQQALGEELKYFFDEVRRLCNEHGKIRFVFGFDS